MLAQAADHAGDLWTGEMRPHGMKGNALPLRKTKPGRPQESPGLVPATPGQDEKDPRLNRLLPQTTAGVAATGILDLKTPLEWND